MLLHKILETIGSSWFLFALSAAILLCFTIRKNNNFFDVRKIFLDQFKMFKNAKEQLLVFYFVPFILSVAVVKIKCIDTTIINNIVIVLSIFISMLFAMLSILNSYNSKKPEYVVVLNETYNTIMFECILCIFALLISFAQFFIGEIKCRWILVLVSAILYYLIFTIILHVFIIIKRMKALFENR